MALREQHVPKAAFNTTPVFVQRARGAVIEDVDGNEYIDFAGGIGVVNAGHCPREVVQAIVEQAREFIHVCFHVTPYEAYVELARRLNELTPGAFPKKTLLVNSGAEAVENGIKVARYATRRHAVIAFENAFHGRTHMAMSLTSKVKPYKWGFGPFAAEVYRIPFAYCYRCPFGMAYPSCEISCADYLEEFFIGNVAPDAVAAVMAEPVQGEGGFVVPPAGYFQKLQAICRKHGILLVMDEVQSGMGRTGKLYASEHFGVAGDLTLTAKSIAAGLPLAAVTGHAEIMDAPHVGGLGGTYGGNPVACKAALAVLDLMMGDLLPRATRLGETVRSRFLALQERHEIIGDVRGLGPMMGMELVRDRHTKEPAESEAKDLVRRCCDRGLIILACGSHGNVIRTLMPLSITREQLDRGLGILDEELRSVAGR
jgi:4-aminobutyrate aminotransferase/(S)-3-amino-2-methylpropionate transaminase